MRCRFMDDTTTVMNHGLGSGVNDNSWLYMRGLSTAGAGAIGRVRLAFVETFMSLTVIAEQVAKTFGRINALIIVIAEGDDRRIFIQHPYKHRPVAMPP